MFFCYMLQKQSLPHMGNLGNLSFGTDRLILYFSTFAAFLSRAVDQIRMGAVCNYKCTIMWSVWQKVKI